MINKNQRKCPRMRSDIICGGGILCKVDVWIVWMVQYLNLYDRWRQTQSRNRGRRRRNYQNPKGILVIQCQTSLPVLNLATILLQENLQLFKVHLNILAITTTGEHMPQVHMHIIRLTNIVEEVGHLLACNMFWIYWQWISNPWFLWK